MRALISKFSVKRSKLHTLKRILVKVVFSHGILDFFHYPFSFVYCLCFVKIPCRVLNVLLLKCSVTHFAVDTTMMTSILFHISLYLCSLKNEVVAWNILFTYMTLVHLPLYFSKIPSLDVARNAMAIVLMRFTMHVIEEYIVHDNEFSFIAISPLFKKIALSHMICNTL